MKKLLIAVMVITMMASYSIAAEKRPLKDVDTDMFTSDTQVTAKDAGDDHMALAWWIPNEFWESVFSRDASTDESGKKAVLDALAGVSLLAVVQADITDMGAFKFYSKEEIEQTMRLSFAGAEDKKQSLSPVKTVGADLESVLGVLKPILGAAMGNFGSNLHFYVLNDKSESSARLIDPYQKGQIDIQLLKRDKSLMDASIEMPLNALFVPRKCPNGRDAHISWNYCPWTGKELEK